MKKIFIVKIQITNDSYNFKKGDYIYIPVLTNHGRNAEEKVLNTYISSEYPLFRYISVIEECKIFKPLL